MTNYTKTTIGKENRIELHEKLSLTGAEISLNELPAGANVPLCGWLGISFNTISYNTISYNAN